jgi:cytoskeleton protein RodZ
MVGFADETVVGGGESVGARLRRAREAHGFSLDDISARTRVPTRHLKAIEEDAFDQLPAAPYSVGFAKAFADAVGLNREEIGREFRAEKEGYGASDAGPSYVSEEPSPAGSGGLVRIVLILVIIAAIAFGLWRSGIFGGPAPVETPAVAPPAVPEATPPAVPPTADTPATSSEENASQASDESSSRTKSSSEENEGTSGKRHGTDSGDETGKAKPSENGAAPAAGSTPSRESDKSGSAVTRQLNLDAQKSASPVAPAPGTTPPVAGPPVITPPPPPPPAATPTPAAPAAPGATP